MDYASYDGDVRDVEDGELLDEAYRASRRSQPARRRPAMRPVRPPSVGGGIQSAQLYTPGDGVAQFELPAPVPTQHDLAKVNDALTDELNRAVARLNANAGDVDELGARVDALSATVRKLRKEQSSQSMLGAISTLLAQQQARKDAEGHVHTVVDANQKELTSGNGILPAGSDNALTALLPFLAMGGLGNGSESGEGSNMNMLLMVLALSGGLR
jgi:hypothetical protein